MIHLQANVNDWTQALPLLPDGALVKATTGWQRFKEVKQANPLLTTCLRHVRDDLQVYQPGHNIDLGAGWFNWEEAKKRARTWFDTFVDTTFRDDIAPFCDAVSWHNEIWANSQNNLERDERVDAAIAALHIWNTEYRNTFSNDIKLVIGEAAVGNSMPREIAALAIAEDGWLGYHPYDYWNNKQRADEGLVAALSMLWDTMEFDWGLKPTWIFTEAGPFESAVTGWRSSECLGGDRDLYVSAVSQWIQDVSQTPAYQEGRIKGFALFTSGGGSMWEGFETKQPELNELAKMVSLEWRPGVYVPPPPPPPPPPADEERGKPRIQYARIYHRVSADATMEQYLEICRQARLTQGTVGGSVDDAMIGDLDSRLMIEYGDQYGETELNLFRDKYYPSVNIEYRPLEIQGNAERNTENADKLEWLWPVDNPRHKVNDPFDAPRSRYYGNHEGIDLFAGFQDPILASRDGDVIWASDRRRSDGSKSLYGNHVIIDHGDSFVSWYAHLDSYSVQAGDVVLQGDVIGRAGSTGNSTGTHLHFNIQHIGHGLSGYILRDVVDPGPLLGV